jgi:hypothetical protein
MLSFDFLFDSQLYIHHSPKYKLFLRGIVMQFKLSICALLCCLTQLSVASTEICPSVEEIKNQNFNHWLPLYIEGEELASDNDVQNFKNHLTQFVVARWDRVYLENGHCFYAGTDPIISKIVFAQDAWRPVQGGKWSWKNPDKTAECYSNTVTDCAFTQ